MKERKTDSKWHSRPSGLVLFPPGQEHVEDRGRKCFEAFKGIHDGHNTPQDFPMLEMAVNAIGRPFF